MIKRFIAAAIAVAALQAQSAVHKSPELAFNLPGQSETLLSRYRGKVVALEFILTTCPHCQAASKVMTKLQQTYASRGLQVIAVAIDPDAGSKVEDFARQYQVAFPVGWTTLERMMAYMGFTGRPVITRRVEELLKIKTAPKAGRAT